MAETRKLHVAMFPWLAFGHIIPFFELSKLLAQKGHRVSFICTPRNIQRLPKIPQKLQHLITLVELPLPHEDRLPENAEATMDVPYDVVPYLKKAYDGLQHPLTRFLTTSAPPDWIIYDFVSYWLPPVVTKLGIRCAFLSLFSAWSGSFMGVLASSEGNFRDERNKPEDFTVPAKWVTFPSKAVFRPWEAKKIFDLVEGNESDISDISRFQLSLDGADMFAIRSCREIEREYLDLFQARYTHKPVIPIGLMPPSILISEENSEENWETIAEWLDKQEQGSVVYVALGTEVAPSQEDFEELALGLELSGLSFFWVLRKMSNSINGGQIKLPDGFEEQNKGRGIVWTRWAPQRRILAHGSVGGFLTHCGWNSIIEGLDFGLPLFMLPYLGDQGLNARVLEDKRAGIEIPRSEEDGRFTRNGVANTLRLVMKENEGHCYRDGAKELGHMVGDKELHRIYIDNLALHLETRQKA